MSIERVARQLFRNEINAAVWPLQGGGINISDTTLGTYMHNVTQVVQAMHDEGLRVVRLVPPRYGPPGDDGFGTELREYQGRLWIVKEEL